MDTVGLDAEKIRKYVKYQEAQEKRAEQREHPPGGGVFAAGWEEGAGITS